MLTIYVYHTIFIVYSSIPRVPMEKLDNSLEATTSTMVWLIWSWFCGIFKTTKNHHNPDQSPSEAKTFTTTFVPSSGLKNLTRSSDFATWFAFKETTSWDFLSIHMASMLGKLLFSGSQTTSDHILRDVKKPSKQRISKSKVNINNNTLFGP